jgi:hypothetical protein
MRVNQNVLAFDIPMHKTARVQVVNTHKYVENDHASTSRLQLNILEISDTPIWQKLHHNPTKNLPQLIGLDKPKTWHNTLVVQTLHGPLLCKKLLPLLKGLDCSESSSTNVETESHFTPHTSTEEPEPYKVCLLEFPKTSKLWGPHGPSI